MLVNHKGAICMAVYKPHPALLSEQISSIRQQSIQDWRCIIGIDGHDPGTYALLADLLRGDERFEIHQFPDRLGFYHNFERVLALVATDAKWVALSDQDDFWYRNKLADLLENIGPASMVLGQARLVRLNNSTLERTQLGITSRSFSDASELILDNVVSGALSLFRTELLAAALPFPEKTDVAYHDHWLGLCAALSAGVKTIPTVVQDYIQHDRNVIGEEKAQGNIFRLRSLLKSAGGPSKVLSYFVNHRWRWRVIMARLALSRFPDIRGRDRQVLEAFAADKSTAALVKIIFTAANRGTISKHRGIALWVGSVLAPAIAEEAHIGAR